MFDEAMHLWLEKLVHNSRRIDPRSSLDCRDWAAVIANRLDPVMVLQSSTHVVPLYRGIIIDITCNVYIKEFDWRTQTNPTNYTPIMSSISIRVDYIQKWYSERATHSFIVPSIRMNMTQIA